MKISEEKLGINKNKKQQRYNKNSVKKNKNKYRGT